MNKILKLSIILFLLIISINTIIYAAGIDMNLNNSGNQEIDASVYGTSTTNTNDTTNRDSESSVPVSVSTSATLSSSDLALSNILNIILIVLGILLLLLGIAILIRMKK